MRSIDGAHHYGITVSDLDRSIEFYRDTLGLDVAMTDRLEGEEISKQVGIDGTVLRIAHLDVEGCLLELLEYEEPGSDEPRDISNNDVGAAHFCIAVDDLEAVYDGLKADVEFISEPVTLGNGAVGVYLRDPDGNPLELLEPPSS